MTRFDNMGKCANSFKKDLFDTETPHFIVFYANIFLKMGNIPIMMIFYNMGKSRGSFKKGVFVTEMPHFVEKILTSNATKWGIILT